RSANVVSRCPSNDGGSAFTMNVSVPPATGFSPPAADGETVVVGGFAVCWQAASTNASASTGARRLRSTATTPLARNVLRVAERRYREARRTTRLVPPAGAPGSPLRRRQRAERSHATSRIQARDARPLRPVVRAEPGRR